MPIELADYDPAEFLDTAEARAEYVSIIMQDGDPAELREALDAVARAERMSGTGQVPSAALGAGDPSVGALNAILDGLGLRLAVVAKT